MPAPARTADDTEGLIDHIRAIEPVVVACVFEEIEPELTRISLRSKCAKVNVNEIAAQFGGGGHPAAAGARIPGKPLSVQRRVIAAVKKRVEFRQVIVMHEFYPFDGAILIDKPAGPTSHDVVDAIRRAFRHQKSRPLRHAGPQRHRPADHRAGQRHQTFRKTDVRRQGL